MCVCDIDRKPAGGNIWLYGVELAKVMQPRRRKFEGGGGEGEGALWEKGGWVRVSVFSPQILE